MSLFKTLSRRGTRNQPAFDEGDDVFSYNYDETPTNAAPRSSATTRKTLDRSSSSRQQSSRNNQPTFDEGEDDGGVSYRATTTSAGSATRKTLDRASSSRSSRNQPAFDEGFDGGVSSYRATTKNSERKTLDRSSSSRSSRNQPAFDEGGHGNSFSTTTTTSAERPSLRASDRPPSFRPSSRRNTPLALGTVRYVNYNARTQHGSLSKALDAARSTGKPILCHFVPPSNEQEHETTTAAAAAVFSDPQMVAVIEECFVPAAFITGDRTDPAVKRYAGERGILAPHYLRIVSPDGQRVVVGLGGHYNSKDDNSRDEEEDADFWCTKETLQCTLVQALEQLGRHVPNALLRVRCTKREERVDL